MKLPVVTRKKHEHALWAQMQHLVGLSLINHGQGVTNGMEAILNWLSDSRAKAIELARPRLEQASVDWVDGFHFGQEWVVTALEELAKNIGERKVDHAATHHVAEDAQR